MRRFESLPILYKKLIRILLLIITVLLVGTIGFMIIQPEYSIIDAFYMTTITLSTVGFQEVLPLGDTARVFTIFLIGIGIATLGYGVSSVTSFIVEGEIKNTFRDRKMEKGIHRLKNHIILCGHGRLGSHAAKELASWNKHFVVIEQNSEIAEKLKVQKVPCIHGNATEDAVLVSAGVEHAHGLIAALSEDTDNLFVALTARRLNRDLVIVSRAEFDNSEMKLLSAGANKVLSPAQIAGRRMASMLINPEVVNFLDVVIDSTYLNLTLQEFRITEGSKLDGVLIRDSGIPRELRIIGLKGPGGKMEVNPGADSELHTGYIMIILGEKVQIDIFRKRLESSKGD